MRIFISIPIFGPILEEIQSFRNDNQEFHVRWLFDHNLHITLLPPIEAGSDKIDSVINRLGKIPLPKPFEISFNSVELGPDSKNKRLIQATGSESIELSNLKSSIEQALKFRPDRKFTPHITLARFKETEVPNLSPLPVHWHMLVKNFALMESRLQATGAEYTIIKTFSF